MSVYQDFSIAKLEDGAIGITMTPPLSISGWTIRTTIQHRFGGVSGFIMALLASGYGNLSGQNISPPSGSYLINGQTGQYAVVIQSVATSGLDWGSYAFSSMRIDSGNSKLLAEGYMELDPSQY
jgi:hypothetical protein